jgi:hypothetical protein
MRNGLLDLRVRPELLDSGLFPARRCKGVFVQEVRTTGKLSTVHFDGEVQQHLGLDLPAMALSRVHPVPVEVLQSGVLRARRAPDDQVRFLLRELPPAPRPIIGQQKFHTLPEASAMRSKVEPADKCKERTRPNSFVTRGGE